MIGESPGGAAVSPDGRRVYVATANGHALFVIDTKTNKLSGAPVTIPG
jgi:DNA-binding beta-propeller fold protein YncE